MHTLTFPQLVICATKKTPHATPATNTLNDDAPTISSPNEHRLTKGPDAETNEGLSPVVDSKKVTGHQGKAEQGAVPHPQAISTKWCYVDVETDGDESFDFEEVDDGSHSDNSNNSSSESNKATETRMTSQHTKHIKGAACQELQTRMEELYSAKHHNIKESQRQQKSRHNIGSFMVQDLHCKKYTNTGLRPQPLAPPNVDQFQQPEANPFELGGICDSDLKDTHLAIAEVRGPQALVTANLKLQCNCVILLAKMRIREKTKGVHPGKPHAMQKHTPVSPMRASMIHIGLVHFLSHALYISDHPFTDWTWDTGTLVKTIQMVFKLTFTNISYALSLQDSIVKAAYDQMKMQRSKIASDVLTLVKTFFEGAEFKNQPEKCGGPAYHKIPIPKSCTLRRDDPDYPFILPIAKTYIGFPTKSSARSNFFQILDQVSKSHWTQALNFTGYDDTENLNNIDESLLSAYHTNFYIPSSPTKPGA
ncbi:hypothetical protein EDB83DRAFT_2309653 [Lactarius deliciosus]|nr:hypothetical protein EDB83DRAFT_2309653 [Lactarius deliciosus]